MPNMKIYVDEVLLRENDALVDTLILRTREMITSGLGVTESTCNIVILGVRSLPDQTPVNIELCLLQKPGRNRTIVEEFCNRLRNLATQVFNAPSAIRCTLADPETYIVIRAG